MKKCVLRAKYFNPRLPLKFITFVEAQTRQNKRMDVDITFGNEKFVVELKVWNGERYIEKGYAQQASGVSLDSEIKRRIFNCF
jgi:hypothetical protein